MNTMKCKCTGGSYFSEGEEMKWEEKCAEAQEYFKRLQYNPRITVNLTKGERIVDELIQAAEEEIALQRGMRQNLDNEIFELNKEISRLREELALTHENWQKIGKNAGRRIAWLRDEIEKQNELGYNAAVYDIVSFMRTCQTDAETIEDQFLSRKALKENSDEL